MKCFVINLKRAVERKQYISNQLNQISQKFEIIEGMDWKDINTSLFSKTSRNIKIKNSFRSLTPGQMGCNLSHRKILNWVAEGSEKMVAVIEDDVRLSKDFCEILDVLENTPQRFDIVFLGSRFKGKQLANLIPLNKQFYFALSKSREKGAWGYVITKEAAQKFLRIVPDITGPIDDALHAYYLHDLKTYTLNPQIVFHEEEGIKFSYNKEKKIGNLKFKEEVLRLISLFFEFFSHKIYKRKRIKSEKVINDN